MTQDHRKEEVSGAKYIIVANVVVNGEVEASDIVGAIFGNTEGLLGEDLELRELLRFSRIGRIRVDLDVSKNRSVGKLYLPSSVDKIETAIIAAALETVDKVGPYNSEIRVEQIKDVREEKLQRIVDRARELLLKWPQQTGPDSAELIAQVRSQLEIAEIIEYGPEKLPAGPSIENSEEMIIVEGRADVLNLLRAGIKNTIATNGVDIPQSIIELSKKKKTIAFPDHDRMGIIILRQLINNASIDYVALPPPGQVVEKLTIKEITKALKNMVPVEQATNIIDPRFLPHDFEVPPRAEKTPKYDAVTGLTPADKLEIPAVVEKTLDPEFAKYQKYYELAEREGVAIFLDSAGNELKRCPVSDVFDELKELSNVSTVIYKGVITQRMVDLCSEKGISVVVAMKTGHLIHKPENIKIISAQ